jgi:flagellar biogenesis protein FliO
MSMFGRSPNQRPLRARQPGFKWWILILVLVVGFPLLLLQTTTPSGRYDVPTTPAATPQVESQEQPIGEDKPFLPEYQPDVIPSLATPEGNGDVEGTAGGAVADAVAEPTWYGMLDVVAKLALVVGLVYLAIAGLRWLQKGRRRSDNAGGAAIRLLETVGLAPGRTLHLVMAGEKTLLIGATDYHLSLLAELPNASAPVVEEAAIAFEEALQREIKPSPEAGSVTGTPGGHGDFTDWRVAVERLRSGAAGVRQALRGTDDEPHA